MKLPNGPKTPGFVQRMQWVLNPLKFMETTAAVYGDCFTARPTGKPSVVFSNPQAIQDIFTARPDQFYVGRANGIFRALLGDYSMMLLDDAPHQRQRKLLAPPLHGDHLRSYGQLIWNITEQVISTWEIGKPFPVRLSMTEISLRVILQTVFGLQEGQRYEKLKLLIQSVLKLSSSPLKALPLFFPLLQQDLGPWSPWGQFKLLKKKVDDLIYAEIQELRDTPDPSRSDILSLMMSAQDNDGKPMTDQEIRDELITLLMAGHEASTSAMTWALYWIHLLPEVHKKLLQELDSIEGNASIDILMKLPYLDAVCCETLRLYPIIMLPSTRMTKTPIRVMDYEFPAGTLLVPSIYLTHHRPDLYPQPKQFRPERFLERKYSQYEFLPFGGGSRRCIGMAFAMFEMKVVLARVLLHLDLAIVGNRRVKPIRRGVTLAPSDGEWLVATSLHEKEVSIPISV
ncbi:cytochrome P450 [Brasilonema sp. UFV-L1]|uniref:cytochrome P450 n=1 Tax=Brasilonema sp. UFV-L1 TaxID=2234130 RepID=UPI00145F9FC7|nr:cytochrome P450 [Brasilonema sp. UFV-L1]NMG08657.1 cytochrome P450 [Brasilonema sp. UFV-L1]